MTKLEEIVEREIAYAIGPEPPPCNDPSATLMAKAINDAWEAALRQACHAVARAVVEEAAKIADPDDATADAQLRRWIAKRIRGLSPSKSTFRNHDSECKFDRYEWCRAYRCRCWCHESVPAGKGE